MKTIKEIFNRLKSPVVLTVVITEIITIIALFNPNLSEQLQVAVLSIGKIVEAFGLLNNPSNKEGF